MLKRKHIAVCLFAFCLTAALLVGVTSSAEYDPWCDIDDSGLIDIVDLVSLAIRFGEEGTPINKTELLLEVNATYSKLLYEINSVNASLVSLQDRVEILETGRFIGAPAYDSDWMFISKGQRLPVYHNLNTTEVFVCIYGKSGEDGIHNIRYGGNWGGTGLTWYGLDDDELTLHRWDSDNNWEKVRVMIWKVLP